MKNLIFPLFFLTILSACTSKRHAPVGEKVAAELPAPVKPMIVEVASFTGAQVTGVTATGDGRLFASFPRWRKEVRYSVLEVFPDGSHRPYPDESWNKYQGKPQKNKFTCVQSVVAHAGSLFVLDPSSPMMEGVVGQAMLYEFDLSTNKLKNSWSFDARVAPKKSYLNDLRVDEQHRKIYITDSGLGGIVVLDLASGKSWRVLDQHKSTKAETVVLSVDKKNFLINGRAPKIHSDGIALSQAGDKLYYHALTGYHLYSVPTEALLESESPVASDDVENLGKTPAPDGMIFDKKGNLFMADLEKNAVVYRTPDGTMKTLVQDERIRWADTFTIDGDYLIFTDSLLQLAKPGAPVENLAFKIYKIALPEAL